MKRRALLVFSVGCLMLAGLAAGAWWRSYRVEDFASYRRVGVGNVAVWSRVGRVTFWRDYYEAADPKMQGRTRWESTDVKASGRWPDGTPGVMGFVWEKGERSPYRAGAAPWWGVVGILGAAGVLGLRVWRRGRAKPAGCCGECGYDLRGTPAGCPECGAGR